MNPIQHPACNDVLRRPPGTTEEECCDLHVMRHPETGNVSSFWEPTAGELAALIAGSPVMLRFESQTHAPVAVLVLAPTDEQKDAVKAAQGRNPWIQLSKDLITHSNKVAKGDPETDRLTDRLLDLILKSRADDQVDLEDYRRDAAEWRAEFERWKKNAKSVEAELDTERELREAAEANLARLHEFTTGMGTGWPLTGVAVEIRQHMEALRREADTAGTPGFPPANPN